MKRKVASDFHPRVLEMFDGYVHGRMSKRAFITQAGKYAAAGVTGAMLLDQLAPNYAMAQQVAPDDPAIVTERITYDSPDGNGPITALMARPADATGPLPAVLVIHENRGLNPYIEDVVRRVAKAGYLALGPDGLSPLGGYPGTDEAGRELQQQIDGASLLEDFFAAFEYLRDHEDSTGRVGAVGFCYGGGVVNSLAVAYAELGAGVPYYGRQPDVADVPQIEAPLMIHYAGLDDRINEGATAYSEALRAAQVKHSVHFYPEVNHGFHNDTTPRYDAAAADLSWDRTMTFFDEMLTRPA